MAEFIPEIAITDFRKLKTSQLKRLKSCEVTSDGEYLFTFVNPQTDYIRLHTENMCQTGNAVGGETLEQVMEGECASV